MITSRIFGGSGAAIAIGEMMARAIATTGRTVEAIRLLRFMLFFPLIWWLS
jgi:hypothetical protein